LFLALRWIFRRKKLKPATNSGTTKWTNTVKKWTGERRSVPQRNIYKLFPLHQQPILHFLHASVRLDSSKAVSGQHVITQHTWHQSIEWSSHDWWCISTTLKHKLAHLLQPFKLLSNYLQNGIRPGTGSVRGKDNYQAYSLKIYCMRCINFQRYGKNAEAHLCINCEANFRLFFYGKLEIQKHKTISPLWLMISGSSLKW
jgi:hypothetical protein